MIWHVFCFKIIVRSLQQTERGLMEILLCGLIVFSFLAALACLVIPASRMRSCIVLFSGTVLVICALLQIPMVPYSFSQQSMLGIDIHGLLQIADFLLLLLILYFGIRHRHVVIQLLAVLQILFLGYLCPRWWWPSVPVVSPAASSGPFITS